MSTQLLTKPQISFFLFSIFCLFTDAAFACVHGLSKWWQGSPITHVTESRCQCIMKVIGMYDDIIYTRGVMEPFVFLCHLEGHPVCPWETDGILLRLSSAKNTLNNRFTRSPAEHTFGQTQLMLQTVESFLSLSTNGKSSTANFFLHLIRARSMKFTHSFEAQLILCILVSCARMMRWEWFVKVLIN